jgi:hypothetical protein
VVVQPCRPCCFQVPPSFCMHRRVSSCILCLQLLLWPLMCAQPAPFACPPSCLGSPAECAQVLRVVDYGAFVELPNGMPTLLHISELSHTRLRDVHELLREGQVRRIVVMPSVHAAACRCTVLPESHAHQHRASASLGQSHVDPSPSPTCPTGV